MATKFLEFKWSVQHTIFLVKKKRSVKIKGSEHLITELFFCEMFCGDSSDTTALNTS